MAGPDLKKEFCRSVPFWEGGFNVYLNFFLKGFKYTHKKVPPPPWFLFFFFSWPCQSIFPPPGTPFKTKEPKKKNPFF